MSAEKVCRIIGPYMAERITSLSEHLMALQASSIIQSAFDGNFIRSNGMFTASMACVSLSLFLHHLALSFRLIHIVLLFVLVPSHQ